MKFKAGDRVKHTGSSDTLTVKAVSDSDGFFTVQDYEHTGHYDPAYFTLVDEGGVSAKEKAILGGLQEHSVGEAYPLAIVAYDHKDHGVLYTIENLQNGKVLVQPTKPSRPRQWDDADFALNYLSCLLGGQVEDPPNDLEVLWAVGRPQFNQYGVLTIDAAEVKAVSYEQRKQQEQAKLRRPLTPREEYELAIAIENGD